MSVREQQIQYIMTKVPQYFGGKDNWLGVKMSPHSPMTFVNEVLKEGVSTNMGFYDWQNCQDSIIATIFQRIKIICE